MMRNVLLAALLVLVVSVAPLSVMRARRRRAPAPPGPQATDQTVAELRAVAMEMAQPAMETPEMIGFEDMTESNDDYLNDLDD